jgi:hypothetical protein
MARWTGVVWRYLRFALLLALAWIAYRFVSTVASCTRDPWKTYPMDSPPDITCRTGSVAGWNVWVWKCVDGERVAIGKHSAEMFSSAARKDTAPCGTLTDLEQHVGIPGLTDCRRGWRWEGGPDEPPIVRRYNLALGSDGSDAIVGSDAADRDAERRRRAVSAAFDAAHDVVHRHGIYAAVDTNGDDLILEMEHNTSPAEVAAVDRELAGIMSPATSR